MNLNSGVPEDVQPGITETSNQNGQPNPTVVVQVHDSVNHEATAPTDTLGEVNMEAAVTADEVVRAGGFGATDAISCVLPVASDSTDFEHHLKNVQVYEGTADNKAQGQSDDILKIGKVDGVNIKENVAAASKDAFGAVDVEASVDSNDVIRAGGFGATDNISSFLPVASDFTDFEAYLRDARDYEDLKEEITRPGLGWTNETK